MFASFNRFELELPAAAVADCSHQGQCDDDVSYWVEKVDFSAISQADIRAELAEYGAWDENELADHEENCKRILWIAAGNIQEEIRNDEN